MAAVTVAAQTTTNRRRPMSSTYTTVCLDGRVHRKYGLITIGNNGDTLATGIKSIVEVAWTPTGVTDLIAPTFSTDGTVTFAAAGGETGHLHVWSND